MKDLKDALGHVRYCEEMEREIELKIESLKLRLAERVECTEQARVKLEETKQAHLDWINAHNQGKL